MFHAHAKTHGDRGLQDEQQPDGGDQPGERVAPQRSEQRAFHRDTDKTDEYQADGDGEKEGKPVSA